jgi:hypothetical protein
MMNYDPNLVLSGRRAKQSVRLTFGIWDYRKTVETVVSGNCRGLTVIECAIENVYENLGNNGWGNKEIVLLTEDGKELACSDDDYDDYEFLEEKLISAEIIGIEPEQAGK